MLYRNRIRTKYGDKTMLKPVKQEESGYFEEKYAEQDFGKVRRC